MPGPPPPTGPPAKGRPAPPTPPSAAERLPLPPPARAGRPPPLRASRPAVKRSVDSCSRDGPSHPFCRPRIMAPVELRDGNSFQMKRQVGRGMCGSVFVGADKVTNQIVALKRMNTVQEKNGFPIATLREVKILKTLTHVNIVNLKEIVTSKEQGAGHIPKNVFMVFEYLEYDLAGILDTPEIRFSQDHVKSWSQQLLRGCHYMHKNKVIHRDLTASNLLVNRRGELKIARWGLARSWNSDMNERLTNRVITLWYRPPELLLGAQEYTPKIDMWSVGCIIAEMFRRSGFLRGSNEVMQLDLIFKTCGYPTKESWPDVHKKCKLWKNFCRKDGEEEPRARVIRQALKTNLPHPRWMTEHAIDLTTY